MLGALLALCGGLACADVPLTLRFETLGVEQGLPQESINALLQDRHGFLWLGTQAGLARYDGYGVRVYRADPGRGDGLIDNYVTTLVEDEQGRLWVGSRGGLQRFRAEREDFETIVPPPGGAGARQVQDMIVGDGGALWIGSAAGLHRYDPARSRYDSWYHQAGAPDSLPHDVVFALAREDSGHLWVGTAAGLARVQAGSRGLQRFRLDDDAHPDPLHNVVRALLVDTAGRLWVGTTAGLEVWTLGAGAPQRRRLGAAEGLPSSDVQVLRTDRDGRVWVGTRTAGLLRWQEESQRFLSYRHQFADSHSLADDYVQTLLQDGTGTLWVGTRTGGASRVDLASGGFERHAVFGDGADPRSARKIYAIAGAADGTLWLGSVGGGMHRLDRHRAELQTYRHIAGDATSLPDDTVMGLHIDARGRYWVGTYRGLSRFDPQTGRFSEQWREPGDPAMERVRLITSDAQGVLWVGTEGGLLRHDPDRGESRVFRHEPSDPRSLGFGRVFAVLPDRRGQLWVGTESGLSRLSADGNTFDHMRPDPTRDDALGNGRIADLYEDRHGRLWIGTGNGLNRLDDPTAAVPRFRRYAEATGLGIEPIGAILAAADGALWVSTDGGINRLDPDSGEVRNYTARDGLIDASYYISSGLALADGSLLFGGAAGLTEFRPERIRANTMPPAVVISDVQLFNQRLDPARLPAGLELRFPVHRAESLSLAHGHSVFSLEFAALHFADPLRNRYAYRLVGLDPDWIEADATQRSVTYSNLAPGHYVFEVRAANKDGVWSEAPATLAIVMAPPWWGTWWARVAAGVLAALGLWAAFRLRVRGLTEQRTRLQGKVAEAVAETLRQKEAIEQAHHNLSVLGEIGREITATLDQAAILAILDRHVHALLDATAFGIYRLDPSARTLESVLCVEEGQPLPEDRIALDNPQRYAARCARERTELLIELAPGDVDPSHRPGTLRILSYLFAPLAIGERLVGVMTVQSPHPHAYGERQRQVFRTLCAYAAIALDNADVYRRLAEADADVQRVLREQQVIFDNVAAAVFFVKDRIVHRCNRGMEEMLGYEPGGLIGQPTRIYHADDASWEALGRTVYPLVTTGKVAEGEWEIVRKDGRPIWIAYRGRALDPGDESLGSIWVAQDITERKRTEAELERIRREQQIIFDNSPGGGVLLTRDRVIVSCTPGLETLLGYAPGELNGKLGRINFPSDEAYENFGRWAYPILAAGGTAKGEVEYCDRHGQSILAYVSGKAIDPADLSQGVVWMAQDIRQQKKDAAELDQARRELQIIFDNNIGAVAIVRNGRLERCSRGFLTMHGYSAEEAIGLPVETFAASHDASAALDQRVAEEMGAGKVVSGEYEYRRKDGSTGWLLYQGRALDPTDLDKGRIWLCQDISELKGQAAALLASKAQVEQSLKDVEQLNRQVTLLGELTGFLQACPSAEEAFSCIGDFGPRLFPDSEGALYLAEEHGNTWIERGHWGRIAQHEAAHSFSSDECWALRRSRAYRVEASAGVPCCPHVAPRAMQRPPYACLPLTAQGKTFGLLHIEHRHYQEAGEADRRYGLAVAMAEQIALAIANVQLREALLQQSIRDPLTGLYNRRYLQESLFREMAHGKRHQTQFAVLMIDVDHFKKFNDTFGHHAGDLVLQNVARTIAARFRRSDIACRYGGEEFTVLLPGTELELAQRLANDLLDGIRDLVLSHESRPLDRITASVGIAVFPEHGNTPHSLLEAADTALYQAKTAGRNRVAVSVDATAR